MSALSKKDSFFVRVDGVMYKAIGVGNRNCDKCEARKSCRPFNKFWKVCRAMEADHLRKMRKGEKIEVI